MASHALGIGRRNQDEKGSKPRDQCNLEQNKIYTTLKCFVNNIRHQILTFDGIRILVTRLGRGVE